MLLRAAAAFAFPFVCVAVEPPQFDSLDATPLATSACGSGKWGPEPCVFGSHMVLASSDPWSGGVTPARVWGFSFPNEAVTITGLPADGVVSPSNPFTADASGKWNVTVSARSSLTAYNLSFSGKNTTVALDDVLFGLSVLCSGQVRDDSPCSPRCACPPPRHLEPSRFLQSNMDMSLCPSCFYCNETLAAAPQFPEIRLKPGGPNGAWTPSAASNATLGAFSAVCYTFAVGLKRHVPALARVPIGLVQSSVGGTVIEAWMSSAALQAAGVPAANATPGVPSCGGQAATELYASLVEPLAPLVVQAMLWYQGESNTDCNVETAPSWRTGYYSRLLQSLVTSWRAAFASPFTALVVQLAAYGSTDATPASRSVDSLPALRESQRAAVAALGAGSPSAGMIEAIDLGDDGYSTYSPPSGRHGGIHPRNKTEFGRRLALRWAQAEGVLPAGVLATGPLLASWAELPGGGGVRLDFDAASAGASGLALAPTADCRTSAHIPAPFNATPAVCCQAAWGAGGPALPGDGASPYAQAGWPFELRLADAASYVLAQATVTPGPAGASVTLAPLNVSVPGPFTGVRYAWQGYPTCVLVNGQQLPASPFAVALSEAVVA